MKQPNGINTNKFNVTGINSKRKRIEAEFYKHNNYHE